jgi:ectoine hydroxylase-related dioxygenase (phytanoyl-CoA dioxygenase family)
MREQAKKEEIAALSWSATNVDELEDRGFTYVANVCSVADLAILRGTLPGLFSERAGLEEGSFHDMLAHDPSAIPASPMLLSPSNYARELKQLSCLRRLTAIARAQLGDDAVLNMEQAILKPARYGSPTPWHQDEAYRKEAEFLYRTLSFWIPLDDADVDSGCLHYVPGSNRGEVLPHRSYASDRDSYALECVDPIGVGRACAVPVKAGDCAAHSARVLHYAGPNRSPRPRIAYVLEFEAPPIPLAQHRVFTWHQGRNPPAQVARGRWLRSGGIFIEAFRRLRKGSIVAGRLRYEWRRSARVLRSYFFT